MQSDQQRELAQRTEEAKEAINSVAESGVFTHVQSPRRNQRRPGGEDVHGFEQRHCTLNLTGAAPEYVTLSGSSAFSVTTQPFSAVCGG